MLPSQAIRKAVDDAKRKKDKAGSIELTGIQINTLSIKCKAMLEELPGLQILALTECHLSSLVHSPVLHKLQTLDLTCNYLEDKDVD